MYNFKEKEIHNSENLLTDDESQTQLHNDNNITDKHNVYNQPAVPELYITDFSNL